jgi:hypothetical protein
MEGDAAWETEDHRNWLDASFKTYFRPLSLPWPYTLKAGEPVEQAVTLTFDPPLTRLKADRPSQAAMVAVGDWTGLAMPAVGLACSAEDLDEAEAALPQLAGHSPQHLACRLSAGDHDLPGICRRFARLAEALRTEPRLEVILPLKEPPAIELDLVATAAASAGLRPASVAVSPALDLKSYPPSVDRPPSPPLAAIYAAARIAFPGVKVGGGMFSYFTELNRRRPPVAAMDFVQHATAAIVHAADDRSVMETLESLPHVIRSARAIAGAVPYWMGPANIAMGFNPYGASTTPNPQRLRQAMVREDPRAEALFGAAWAAGYLARAVAGGVEAVTLLGPGGPFGVADATRRRPAFHVLQSFAAAGGAPSLACVSSQPQRLLACACVKDGRTFLWLVNLTPDTLPVTLAGLRPASVMLLEDGEPTEHSANAPLTLSAYAIAFIEG